jgi:hypothetical protein
MRRPLVHPECSEPSIRPGGKQSFGTSQPPSLDKPLGGTVRGVEDGADVLSNFGLHVFARHVGLCILLQVELAMLLGSASEDGQASSSQTGVVIAGHEFDS